MLMHILTVGSRGDIEPLAALGAGLRDAGHRVTIVANSEGRAPAERAGVGFGDLQFSVADLLRSGAGAAILHGGSSHQSRTALIDAAVAAFPVVGPRIVDACAGADVILSTETLHLLARSIAEQRNIPHIALSFAPYGRTAAYPSFYADSPELRSLPTLDTHDRVQRYHHTRFLPVVNALRADRLGLPPLSVDAAHAGREACAAVLGYSPAVCPPPDDWPSHRDVVGYWRSRVEPLPDAALADFVSGGEPPLYVGFGSMQYDAARVVPLLRTIAARTGVRIVYATGWADVAPADVPGSIFVVRDAPHAWLFPRVLGAVHHGGAGTTGAAISAGAPSLVAWLIVDQPFWASRVEHLGVGVDLGPFQALNDEVVVAAVRRLQVDGSIAARAAHLRHRVGPEDGVAAGVAAIERHVRAWGVEGTDAVSRAH